MTQAERAGFGVEAVARVEPARRAAGSELGNRLVPAQRDQRERSVPGGRRERERRVCPPSSERACGRVDGSRRGAEDERDGVRWGSDVSDRIEVERPRDERKRIIALEGPTARKHRGRGNGGRARCDRPPGRQRSDPRRRGDDE
jgi:hypothetical protein